MQRRKKITAVAILMLAAAGPLLSAEAPSAPPKVVSWNDKCQAIWNDQWGGPEIRGLLDPSVKELQAKGGVEVDDKYRKDAVKWLAAAVKPGLLPKDAWEHAVPLKSHLLVAADMDIFPSMCRRIRRSRLSVKTYKPQRGVDTSGIVLRYETEDYVILLADKSKRMCVLIKDKRAPEKLESIESRVRFLWNLMTKVFVDDVWKPGGAPVSVQFWRDASETKVFTALLNAPIPGSNKALLNDHFSGVLLTLPPGPVVRAVFVKRLRPKKSGARLYIPKTRFEERTLFENQDFRDGPRPTSPTAGGIPHGAKGKAPFKFSIGVTAYRAKKEYFAGEPICVRATIRAAAQAPATGLLRIGAADLPWHGNITFAVYRVALTSPKTKGGKRTLLKDVKVELGGPPASKARELKANQVVRSFWAIGPQTSAKLPPGRYVIQAVFDTTARKESHPDLYHGRLTSNEVAITVNKPTDESAQADVLSAQARYLELKGDAKNAIKLLEKVFKNHPLKTHPKIKKLHCRLGRAYEIDGDIPNAIKHYRLYVKWVRDSKFPRTGKGGLAEHADRIERTADALEKYLEKKRKAKGRQVSAADPSAPFRQANSATLWATPAPPGEPRRRPGEPGASRLSHVSHGRKAVVSSHGSHGREPVV